MEQQRIFTFGGDTHFEKQLKQLLKGFNQKQQYQFAWLCGVRALPFLSVKRGFVYWPEDKKQEFLYSIFYALDVTARAAFGDNNAYAAVYNRLGVAFANSAIAGFFDPSVSAAHYVTVAVHIAAEIAAGSTVDAKAAFHIATAVTEAAKRAGCKLETVVLEDIKAIKENRLNEYKLNASVYGNIWNNFQEDLKLKTVDCAYWAWFYEKLFKNSVDIDKKQLERRINIPDEIKVDCEKFKGELPDKGIVINSYMKITKNYFMIEEDTMNQISINGDHNNVVNRSDGAIVGSNVILDLPTSVDEETFNQILLKLEEFLASEQAKNLTIKDFEATKTELAEARKLGHKGGWERFRQFLSGAANVATIIAPFLLI
jgi:hypothetical protein